MIKPHFPFSEYQNHPGINNSSFASIDPDRGGCPAIYHAEQNGDAEPIDSEALSFGRAVHSYVLERDTFAQEFAVESQAARDEILATAQASAKGKPPEKFSRRLGAYQAWKKDLAAKGKTLLTEFDASKLERMHQALLRHKVVGPMLMDSDKELSLFAQLQDHQGRAIPCKGRLDICTDTRVVDIKTVAKASPRELGSFIARYKLHIQAAFYLDLCARCGLDRKSFGWAFVDKRAPFPVVYYEADPEMIELGRREYKSFLGWIIDGNEKGLWPGHPDMVELPGWFSSLLEEI